MTNGTLASALAATLAAISLVGCGSLRTDLASERPDSEVAVLEGSWMDRFFWSAKADIAAIDGRRMQTSIFVSTVNSIRLLPGRHWVEFTSEVHHDVPFGGWNICTCAFELDFEAQHRYQLKSDSSTYDVPCWKQVRLQRYGGSILMDVSFPGEAPKTQTVAAVCTGGGLPSFCRKDADCGPKDNNRCVLETGTAFGFCEIDR
jgi:hypothetical protein